MQFQLTFEGNLGADPELRISPSGIPVAKMSVVHNTRRRNQSGEWVDGTPLWIQVTCWRDLAERVAKLHRGDAIIVDARDDLSAWAFLTREDEPRPAARLQVTANNVAVSMRFADAQALRKPRQGQPAEADDVWAGTDAQVPENAAELDEQLQSA
ncbi:MAG: single-strand DNA-binding protein [Micromonosporaceae bacterium]|nr:single-strand DNA-binding protein [Micromonosporaceae bacterium]